MKLESTTLEKAADYFLRLVYFPEGPTEPHIFVLNLLGHSELRASIYTEFNLGLPNITLRALNSFLGPQTTTENLYHDT